MSAPVLAEQLDTTPYARCRRQSDGLYAPKLYTGSQRPPMPSRPDELGAVCVVDHVFGGRSAIHAISGDREWVRVETLP
jgi:hypothetical protein